MTWLVRCLVHSPVQIRVLGGSPYLLINVYVFIFLKGKSIVPCAWAGGGARREPRRKGEVADLNRLWAHVTLQQNFKFVNVGQRENQSPARVGAAPPRDRPTRKTKRLVHWGASATTLSGGPEVADDGEPGPVVADIPQRVLTRRTSCGSRRGRRGGGDGQGGGRAAETEAGDDVC